ncbi:MAG TPA: hypothetical protein VFD90_14640 [Gaiellales bacterium]|jgi:hypothetical protein|nr:hypothetical protein [Gaiellales bacterium]
MVIASAGVFGTGVPVGIFAILGLRVLLYVKRRNERAQLYGRLPPDHLAELKAAHRRSALIDIAARIVWVIGFLATLVATVALVHWLLGPGLASILVAIALWLALMFVLWKLIGAGVRAAWYR